MQKPGSLNANPIFNAGSKILSTMTLAKFFLLMK